MRRALALAAFALGACRPPIAPPPEPIVGANARGAAPTGPLDPRPWLAPDAAAAATAGAGPLSVVATDVGTDGDRVGGFVSLPPAACLLVFARGSHAIDDLDLLAFADDGSVLASDEAPDPRPAVLLCPPGPARAYVSARVAAGRGLVAIGAAEVPVAQAAAVGKALGARGRPGEEAGRVEIWPGLDEKVAARRQRVPGPWEEIRRVAVPLDVRAPTRVSALLDAGRCLDVLVAPADEVGMLDVALLDGEGRSIGRATMEGRDRTAVVCTPVQSPVSVEIRPHAGQGLAAVVLARSAPGGDRTIAPTLPLARIAPSADLATARAERSKLLAALGLAPARAVMRAGAEVGRSTSQPFDVADGCARVDVVAGAPAAGITARIWDAAGDLVAEDAAGAGPALFACGRARKLRIDVEATVRPGPVAVELRADPRAPAALVQHPLAASRLLARLDARDAPIAPSAAAGARAVALDATRLARLEAEVPAGKCLDAVAALDAGAAGLDLRVVDPRGEEVARARGRGVASARACADAEARPLRVELRAASGRADALFVARVVEPAR